MKSFFSLLAFAILAVLMGMPATVHAAYPSKEITFIVPFPPGGRTDLIGRMFALQLGKQLGITVVIVNKAGAGGTLGALEVKRAPPDGYTLGFFSGAALVTSQYTVAAPISLNDFEVVGIVSEDPAAIAVNAGAPWKTLRELADHAKKYPGKLRIGMIPGASNQVFAGGFAKAAGVDMVMVPFKGDVDGAIALAGGHIDVHVSVPVAYKTLAEAKKIRILAIAADQRSPLYKDLPTFKENGVDFVISAFLSVHAPKDTPTDALNTISSALGRVANSPELKEQMRSAGAEILYLPRAEAAGYLARMDQIYKRTIEDLGIMKGGKK